MQMNGLTCKNDLVMKQQEMIFKVPWDKPARVVTWVSSAILLVAITLCVGFAIMEPGYAVLYVGLLVLIVLIPLYFCSQSPRAILLTDDALVVCKAVGRKAIPFSEIHSIALLNKYSALRIFASGGFFGYVGLFWNREFGKHRVLAGSLRQPVCVNLVSGKRYVLSCSDGKELLQAMKNHAHQ